MSEGLHQSAREHKSNSTLNTGTESLTTFILVWVKINEKWLVGSSFDDMAQCYQDQKFLIESRNDYHTF